MVDTAVEIHAPASIVWSIVTDTDKYPEWNPLQRALRWDKPADKWKVGATFVIDTDYGKVDETLVLFDARNYCVQWRVRPLAK